MKWNDDWRDWLKTFRYGIYERLCECRNTKHDILIMARAMYCFNDEWASVKDCLDRAIEWVCDWNGQYDIDFSNEEYDNYLKSM